MHAARGLLKSYSFRPGGATSFGCRGGGVDRRPMLGVGLRRGTPSVMDGAALSAWPARTSVARTILVALAVALAASWPAADSTRPMLMHDEGGDALIAVRSRRQAAPSGARSAASARASCRSNSLAASPSGAAAHLGASHPLRCFDPAIAPGGLAQNPRRRPHARTASASRYPHAHRAQQPAALATQSPGGVRGPSCVICLNLLHDG
jgi:hypothetical protein